MIKNVREVKMSLRANYRAIRENMNPFYKKIMDEKIMKNLCILNKYKNADVILVYISKEIEVDTYCIMERCWADGKKVAAPICNTEDKSMEFYIIKSLDDLSVGNFGLLEPDPTKCEKVTEFANSICIVPGFSFDKDAYRLGYGHGYYDRFLQRFNGTTIGLCYNNCICAKLPHGRFDFPVDILITNAYIKEIQKSIPTAQNLNK